MCAHTLLLCVTLQVGFDSFGTDLPEDVTQEQLLKVVADYNADPKVHPEHLLHVFPCCISTTYWDFSPSVCYWHEATQSLLIPPAGSHLCVAYRWPA